MLLCQRNRSIVGLTALFALSAGVSPLLADYAYSQTNLVSNVPGLAQNTDPNLINPWGISFSKTSPFWVSNQGSNNATLYNGAGSPRPLVVSTAAGPTGQVFNGSSDFVAPNGNSSLFLFATLSGTIDAWNGASGTSAATVATTPGAAYTGLALANNGSGNFLYAANALGGIDVFNATFQKTTLSGSFTDPNLPAGYTPYNIQNVGGNLLVEYTQGRNTGAGIGVVDQFDANGNFTKRLVTGGALNAPWGVTLAPSGFGQFAGDLLVGNFGDGHINAYDPNTGAFQGTLTDASGKPFANEGLWGLAFRDAPGFNPNSLYFAAGINGEQGGLFGAITPTPEPATFAIAGIGLASIVLAVQRRSSK